MRDYATELGKNAERIGKEEEVYTVPGTTDGFSTNDKATADALSGMAMMQPSRRPTPTAPPPTLLLRASRRCPHPSRRKDDPQLHPGRL